MASGRRAARDAHRGGADHPRLPDGEHVNWRGKHVDVESARLCSVHDQRPEIGVAASGPRSSALAAEHADFLIATDPDADLVSGYEQQAGPGRAKVGQIAGCHHQDRDTAVRRAHEQFRWFGLGWKVDSDLPGPSSFEAATQSVTPEQVGEQLPCGPDVEEWVRKIQPFRYAGFTEVALVQIGADSQEEFCRWAVAPVASAGPG